MLRQQCEKCKRKATYGARFDYDSRWHLFCAACVVELLSKPALFLIQRLDGQVLAEVDEGARKDGGGDLTKPLA